MNLIVCFKGYSLLCMCTLINCTLLNNVFGIFEEVELYGQFACSVQNVVNVIWCFIVELY